MLVDESGLRSRVFPLLDLGKTGCRSTPRSVSAATWQSSNIEPLELDVTDWRSDILEVTTDTVTGGTAQNGNGSQL